MNRRARRDLSTARRLARDLRDVAADVLLTEDGPSAEFAAAVLEADAAFVVRLARRHARVCRLIKAQKGLIGIYEGEKGTAGKLIAGQRQQIENYKGLVGSLKRQVENLRELADSYAERLRRRGAEPVAEGPPAKCGK